MSQTSRLDERLDEALEESFPASDPPAVHAVETGSAVPGRSSAATTESLTIKLSTAPYAALLLRVSLGTLFLAHVALKIFVFTVPGFVGFFGSLGLPAILAYAVIALELLGGIALILGLYAPWVALPLAAEMAGSIVFVHGANGWLFTNKGGGWEYPAFWTLALVALYLLGDGAMALVPTQRPRR
jgi:putative oxidoreductase